MTRFKDYDAVVEAEREQFEFTIGGKAFVAPSEQEARTMLQFLRLTASENPASMVEAIEIVVGEEVSAHIYEEDRSGMTWAALQSLVNDLAIYYGGGVVGDPKVVFQPKSVTNGAPTEEEPFKNGESEISTTLSSGEISNDTESPLTE